jgi:hypothetical protein
MSDQSYVQVPPQSTGKKVATVGLTQLPVDNLSTSFDRGDIVIGALSGTTGTVTGSNISGTTGTLFLRNVHNAFINNEALQVSAVTYATANITADAPQTDFDVQKITIADPNNPSFIQKIDRFGATVNTFTDGSPVFGPFGTLVTGQPQISRVYRFSTGLEENKWYTVTAGSATSTWEGDKTASLLTTSASSGDLVQRTTNYYHPYVPGVGLNIEFTTQVGDTGKTGCRRRWGYFDDDNGFFFELDGTDFFVVKRSSTTGTPVDTRVVQADFNRDTVDGNDELVLALDVSKGNMYWIDIQWYGTGLVRFGMYEPGGTRIPLHEFQHANLIADYPYTRTATLPLRFEQENTSATSGTSQMRHTGALVKDAYKVNVNGNKRTGDSGLKTITTGSEVPLFGFRPKTVVNGYANRSIIKGIATSFANISNTGGGPVLFRIRGCYADGLTNENFLSLSDESITEIDIAATAIIPALTIAGVSYVVGAGDSLFVQDEVDRTLDTFETVLGADGALQPIIVITAECMSGTNADVFTTVNWEEIKY